MEKPSRKFKWVEQPEEQVELTLPEEHQEMSLAEFAEEYEKLLQMAKKLRLVDLQQRQLPQLQQQPNLQPQVPFEYQQGITYLPNTGVITYPSTTTTPSIYNDMNSNVVYYPITASMTNLGSSQLK